MGSTLKPGGSRAVCDIHKTIFVQGAYNLGPVLENFEVVTTGFIPGMTVDPLPTVGLEEQCTIGANASVVVIGIAEIDFGVLADTDTAYVATDSAPILKPHWNPGALLRNLARVTALGDTHPGDYWGTTSGVAGRLDQDLNTGVMIRGQNFDAAAAGSVNTLVGWFACGPAGGI